MTGYSKSHGITGGWERIIWNLICKKPNGWIVEWLMMGLPLATFGCGSSVPPCGMSEGVKITKRFTSPVVRRENEEALVRVANRLGPQPPCLFCFTCKGRLDSGEEASSFEEQNLPEQILFLSVHVFMGRCRFRRWKLWVAARQPVLIYPAYLTVHTCAQNVTYEHNGPCEASEHPTPSFDQDGRLPTSSPALLFHWPQRPAWM